MRCPAPMANRCRLPASCRPLPVPLRRKSLRSRRMPCTTRLSPPNLANRARIPMPTLFREPMVSLCQPVANFQSPPVQLKQIKPSLASRATMPMRMCFPVPRVSLCRLLVTRLPRRAKIRLPSPRHPKPLRQQRRIPWPPHRSLMLMARYQSRRRRPSLPRLRRSRGPLSTTDRK